MIGVLNNKKHVRLMLKIPLYLLPVYFAACLQVWAENTDTLIASGTERSIADFTFENGMNGTYILQAKKGATITTTNVVLNSTGILGGGAWIDNSILLGQDLHINVSGRSGTGVYLANDASATLTRLNVSATNNAKGVVLDGVWSGSGALAAAEIVDSNITTSAGDAFYVIAGDLTLKNVLASTQGDSSYAVNVDSHAKVTAERGTFTTQGTYSDAIWVSGQDASVTLQNTVVTTQGDRASAINAQRGTAEVTQSTLETHGRNSYGLYTENQIKGDDLSITTFGTGGVGMFTAQGGQGELRNSTITTYGELAAGLAAWPGSTVTADNVEITTSGLEGYGLWGRAGSLDISNSVISTSGEAASGLYANGYSSTPSLKNVVSLNNVTLKADRAQAIEVDTTRLSLVATDSILTGGNGQLMTVTHYEDASDPASNLYSDVTFDAVNSTLEGDIVVSDALNSVAVNLSSNTVLTGAVTNATSLSLDSSSRWDMSNHSNVGQLTNNGTVTFSSLNNFDTLTVTGDYAGDGGLLIMNSILGDDSSPANKLIVGGDVQQGTTRVSINNLGGHGAQTVEGIEIVEVGGISYGSFAKAGRIIAGAYDYDLVKKGENWYLTSQTTAVAPALLPDLVPDRVFTPTAPSVVRPEGGSYTANLAAANTVFMMTLHDRLGETQFIDALTGQPDVTSLWLRQIGGHNRWRDNSGQLQTQSNRYMSQIGGDVAQWSAGGADRWHLGFMAGYANNQSSTVNHVTGYRSEGKTTGYSVGGYATWYANQEEHTGAWLDSWLQYSWFDNDVSGENLAAENYKSHGFTASLESGYTWKTGQFKGSKGTVNSWFVQPQAQVVWMGVRADDHQEANGTHIRGEGDGNLVTRLGIRTWLNSHHAQDDGKQREFQPYLALNWLHNTRNFSTKMDDVQVSQNGATNLGEVKVGLEGQLNPRLNIWGNIGVQVGDKGYNDTAALAGVKYHF